MVLLVCWWCCSKWCSGERNAWGAGGSSSGASRQTAAAARRPAQALCGAANQLPAPLQPPSVRTSKPYIDPPTTTPPHQARPQLPSSTTTTHAASDRSNAYLGFSHLETSHQMPSGHSSAAPPTTEPATTSAVCERDLVGGGVSVQRCERVVRACSRQQRRVRVSCACVAPLFAGRSPPPVLSSASAAPASRLASWLAAARD